MTKSLRRKGFVIHELESLWECGTYVKFYDFIF
ncbi:hypothetical protein JOE44_002809 [Chryseobacterium sp. PvR013]|nr:hypothetical protein [Chryseobacterium sp. PvR013]